MGNSMESLMDIQKKYKTDSLHLLLPSVQMQNGGSSMYCYSIATVVADLSPNSGDVYSLGYTPVYDENGNKIEKKFEKVFGIAKPFLHKIATAAGIQFDPNNSGIMPTGSKDIFMARATGVIRLMDGNVTNRFDEKIVDISEEENKIKAAIRVQIDHGFQEKRGKELSRSYKGHFIKKTYGTNGHENEYRLFFLEPADAERYLVSETKKEMIKVRADAPQKALTGAELRVIRSLIGLNAKYTESELRKPFIIPRVSFRPDFNDPETKRMALQYGLQSMGSMFGAPAVIQQGQPIIPQYVNSLENDEDIQDEDIIPVNPDPTSEEPQKPSAPEKESKCASNAVPQKSKPDDKKNTEDSGNGPVCSACGSTVTERTKNYTIKKYGKVLCYACQKKTGGNEQ